MAEKEIKDQVSSLYALYLSKYTRQEIIKRPFWNRTIKENYPIDNMSIFVVVVVYHVTIVAIGHGLLKKFWPF